MNEVVYACLGIDIAYMVRRKGIWQVGNIKVITKSVKKPEANA
jgi:hypothetical protein